MNRITKIALTTVAITALAIPAFAAKSDKPVSAVTAAAETEHGRDAEDRAAFKEARKEKREAMKALWTAEEFDAEAIRAAVAEREDEQLARKAERLENRIAKFEAMSPEERVAAFEEGKDRRRERGMRGKRGHGERGEMGEGRGHGKRGDHERGDRKRGDCDNDE